MKPTTNIYQAPYRPSGEPSGPMKRTLRAALLLNGCGTLNRWKIWVNHGTSEIYHRILKLLNKVFTTKSQRHQGGTARTTQTNNHGITAGTARTTQTRTETMSEPSRRLPLCDPGDRRGHALTNGAVSYSDRRSPTHSGFLQIFSAASLLSDGGRPLRHTPTHGGRSPALFSIARDPATIRNHETIWPRATRHKPLRSTCPPAKRSGSVKDSCVHGGGSPDPKRERRPE